MRINKMAQNVISLITSHFSTAVFRRITEEFKTEVMRP
jgi:hypothetical protein